MAERISEAAISGAHRVMKWRQGAHGESIGAHGESIGAHGESIGAHGDAPVWSDPGLTPGGDFYTVQIGDGKTIELCPVCFQEMATDVLNQLLAASTGIDAHGESIGAHGESIGAHGSVSRKPLGYGGD